MDGVMSLLTRTPGFRLSREFLLVHTLSVAYAGRQFRKLHFVTDSYGAEIAGAMGWDFSTVRVTLDSIPDRVTGAWAVGKAYSLFYTEGDALAHIDYDAFLTKPLPAWITSAPMFAERVDRPDYYISRDMKRGMKLLGMNPGEAAYSCGIVGGADREHLSAYACGFIDLATALCRAGIDGTAASMLSEQYWLGEFSRRNRVPVERLLRMRPTAEEIREIGWTHLHGKAKRDPENLLRVEARLKSDFPREYANFLRGNWKLRQKKAYAAA